MANRIFVFVHVAKNYMLVTARNSSAHFKTNKIKNLKFSADFVLDTTIKF